MVLSTYGVEFLGDAYNGSMLGLHPSRTGSIPVFPTK